MWVHIHPALWASVTTFVLSTVALVGLLGERPRMRETSR